MDNPGEYDKKKMSESEINDLLSAIAGPPPECLDSVPAERCVPEKDEDPAILEGFKQPEEEVSLTVVIGSAATRTYRQLMSIDSSSNLFPISRFRGESALLYANGVLYGECRIIGAGEGADILVTKVYGVSQ